MGGDVEDAVGGDGRVLDGDAEVVVGDDLFIFGGGEDEEFAAGVADVDFAVADEGGAPDGGFGGVGPALFAGDGVVAVDVAAEVADEEEGLPGDFDKGRRAEGAVDGGVVPEHFAGLLVEAAKAADAVAVVGVLADGDVDAVLVDDGGADDFGGSGFAVVVFGAVIGGIGVGDPEFFEEAGLAGGRGGDGLGVEGVEEAFATAEDDSVAAGDFAEGGVGPVSVEDFAGHEAIIEGDELAGGFVEDAEGGGVGAVGDFVALIDAVVGAGVDEVAVDEGGAIGGVVGRDFEFLDEVVEPDDVAVEFGGFGDFGGGAAGAGIDIGVIAGFIFEGAGVAGGEPGDGEAGEFAAAAHEVKAVAIDVGGGAKTEAEVVEVFEIGAGGGELPEEVSVFFVEAEEDGAVAAVLGFAGVFVVGADESAAVGDDGGAVGFVAEFGGPFEIEGGAFFAGVDGVGEAGFGGGHVAVVVAAELGPIGGGG